MDEPWMALVLATLCAAVVAAVLMLLSSRTGHERLTRVAWWVVLTIVLLFVAVFAVTFVAGWYGASGWISLGRADTMA